MNTMLKDYPAFPHPGDGFFSPTYWLRLIASYMSQLKADNPQYPLENFRRHNHKDAHEAWMAATFAFGFGCAHRLGDLTMRHNGEEYSDADAVYRWTENGRQIEAPVQVKQLPPEQINRKETIEGLVEKVRKKYPTSGDLIVALHLDRTEKFAKQYRFQQTVAQLWFWGWTDPHSRELFLTGSTHSGQRTFWVPFDLRVDMAKAVVREKTDTQ